MNVYDDIEYKLHQLATRRRVLESQHEVRLSTLKEMNQIKASRHNRLLYGIQHQNELAKARNDKLLHELNRSISSIGAHRQRHSVVVSSSSDDSVSSFIDDDYKNNATAKLDTIKQLKQAKHEYYRHVEATLPLLCRYEGIRLEQKKKEIMIEKKLIIRRGELLNEELSKNSLIRQDIEKQRYDILMNLKDQQRILVEANAKSIMLHHNSRRTDEILMESIMDDAYDIKRRMYDHINEDSVKYGRSSSVHHPYINQQDNSSSSDYDYEKNGNRPLPSAAIAIESLFNKPSSSSSSYNNISSSSLHVGGHDQRQQGDGGGSIHAQQFNSRSDRVDDSITAPTQKFIQHSTMKSPPYAIERTVPVLTSVSDIPFNDLHPTTIYTADDHLHHHQPPPFSSSSSNDAFNLPSPTAGPTTSLLSRQPMGAPTTTLTTAIAATSSSRQELLSPHHRSSLVVALTSSIPPIHDDRLSTLKEEKVNEDDQDVSSSSPTTVVAPLAGNISPIDPDSATGEKNDPSSVPEVVTSKHLGLNVHYQNDDDDDNDNDIVNNKKHRNNIIILASSHDQELSRNINHSINNNQSIIINNNNNNNSIISTLGGNQSNNNSSSSSVTDTSSLLHTISTATRGEEQPVVAAAAAATTDHTTTTSTTTTDVVASFRDRVHGIIRAWSNQRTNALLVIVCGQIETKSSLISKKDGASSITSISLKEIYDFDSYFKHGGNMSAIISIIEPMDVSLSSGQLQQQRHHEDDSIDDSAVDAIEAAEMSVLGDLVITIASIKSEALIPSSAFVGVVGIDKLKAEYKRQGSPGIAKLWDTLISHLQIIVMLQTTTYLHSLSKHFTTILTSHVIDSEDRSRLHRKVMNLLQLALLPDDHPSSPNHHHPSSSSKSALNNSSSSSSFLMSPVAIKNPTTTTNTTTASSSSSAASNSPYKPRKIPPPIVFSSVSLQQSHSITHLHSTTPISSSDDVLRDVIISPIDQALKKGSSSSASKIKNHYNPIITSMQNNNNSNNNKHHKFILPYSEFTKTNKIAELEDDEIESDPSLEKPPPLRDLDALTSPPGILRSGNGSSSPFIDGGGGGGGVKPVVVVASTSSVVMMQAGHVHSNRNSAMDDEFDF